MQTFHRTKTYPHATKKEKHFHPYIEILFDDMLQKDDQPPYCKQIVICQTFAAALIFVSCAQFKTFVAKYVFSPLCKSL